LDKLSEAICYTPQKYLETVWQRKETIRLFQDTPLYPRTKGFIATAKKLGASGSMQAAHDLTRAYTHHDRFFGAPTLWKTLPPPDLDKDWRFHVCVKRFELDERAGRQICRPSNDILPPPSGDALKAVALSHLTRTYCNTIHIILLDYPAGI
jgi:hypothetical protein